MADERGALAYLVRLWSVHHNGDLVWRASTENAHTGERHAFADLAELYEFLQAAVMDAPPPTVYSECRADDRAAQLKPIVHKEMTYGTLHCYQCNTHSRQRVGGC